MSTPARTLQAKTRWKDCSFEFQETGDQPENSALFALRPQNRHVGEEDIQDGLLGDWL